MLTMDIKTVLIEKEDRSLLNVISSSAILIEQKYVLTTSNILSRFFQENLELLDSIPTGKLHRYKGKNKFTVRVIWKHDDNNNLLVSKQANIFAVIKCENIEKFCKYELKDWTVDLKENNFNSKNLLSIFLLFAIEHETVHETEFKSMLHTWLLNLSSMSLNKGDRIICRSCPFGTRDFLNSLSEGIISSTFEKSFLLLSDCSSCPGCEGGLVYSKENSVIPVGIIISSLNWWRKEWVGFTLIASIQPILCQIVDLQLGLNKHFKTNPLEKLLDVAESSLAQINCGVDWGTCILLSKQEGIFITNAHVVKHELSIRLFWKNKSMSATLIYKNPDDSAFDLAVVKCDEDLSFMWPCDTSVIPYSSGDEVYCAGYPLLSTLSKPDGVTVTHGIISDCNPYMIKTTCGVFPGYSGGAVFSSKGALLGIIVCNTRLTDIDVTYPKINMAIPYKAIVDVISEYIMKNCDYQVLTKLGTFDFHAARMWMRLQAGL